MEKYLQHPGLKDDFLAFEKEHPGYFEFLEALQLGNKIKFNQLKFGEKPKDVVIEVVYREETGDNSKVTDGKYFMRANGMGCIEYANILPNGEYSPLHKDGYFPCQTFMSMRDWFRYSDSYEVIN